MIQKIKNQFFRIMFFTLLPIISYSQNGSLDLTFNSFTEISSNTIESTDGDINTLSRQSSGKIIIGGNFTSINNISINRIARLNIDGTLDTSFNIGNGITGGSVEKIIVLPDDKILVAGRFNTFNNLPMSRIVKLNADGTLDTTFNIGTGVGSLGHISCMELKSNNQIIIAGIIPTYNNTATSNLVLLNQNGGIDSTFNVSSSLIPGAIFSMELQSDNKIIVYNVVKILGSPSSTATSYLKRFNANGSLDNTFSFNSTIFLSSTSSGFLPSVRIIYDIKQLSNGKILISGDFNTVYGQTYGGIARLNSNGTVDTTFNVGTGISSGTTQIVYGTYNIYSIDVQPDNKIIIGVSFQSFNNTSRNLLQG